MLTDDCFNGIALQFQAYPKLFHRGQKLMNVMPPFIAYGFACGIHLPLVLGFTVVIIPNLDPAKLGSLVLKHKPEHMFGVPTHYQQLAADPKLRDKDLSFITTTPPAATPSPGGPSRPSTIFWLPTGPGTPLPRATA